MECEFFGVASFVKQQIPTPILAAAQLRMARNDNVVSDEQRQKPRTEPALSAVEGSVRATRAKSKGHGEMVSKGKI